MKVGIHPEYVETTVTCGCGEKMLQNINIKYYLFLNKCNKDTSLRL